MKNDSEFPEIPEVPETPTRSETGEPIPDMTTSHYAKPQKTRF